MDMEQPSQYVNSGLDVVNIKIVRNLEDVDEEDDYFKPDMCHQVFGDNENVFGYQNLKINILYDACTFMCYITSTYDEKLERDPVTGLEAENFMDKLNPWLPMDFITDKNSFLKHVASKKKIGMFGEPISAFDHKDGKRYEICVCNSSEVGYKDFHQRMETMIVWFIDAANFIDVDDEKWMFFILYEKIQRGKYSPKHYPVGYATVYEYYAFPDLRRYRISQFIIFPPFQNMGLGTELLKTVYRHLSTLPNIHDITVEDPSEKFQLMRDFVDAKMCMNLPKFNQAAIKSDFSKDMVIEARNNCKINEKQTRRVYEILRLLYTNVDDQQDYNTYKMIVKNRLNAPYKRQEKSNKKLKTIFKDLPQLQELQRSDHRIKILEKEFQQVLKQYRHVINRLQKQ